MLALHILRKYAHSLQEIFGKYCEGVLVVCRY